MNDTRAPHVLVTNVVALNGGDAAILDSLIRGLRRRLGDAVRITVLSSQAEVSARYHADLGVVFREPLARLVLRADRAHPTRIGRALERDVLRRLSSARFAAGMALRARGGRAAGFLLTRAERELVDLYDDADFIVASGGTYLVENYAIEPRLLEFRVAMRLRAPLALFTQSMGPFGRRSAERLRPVFEYCRLVLLRDEPSLGHLCSTGAGDVHTAVVADAAFALGDGAAVAAARSPATRSNRPLRVAISVRDWPFFRSKSGAQGMRDVVAAFAALTEHLVTVHGAQVTFVSTCQGIPEYWKDDARPAREIVAALAARGSRTGRVSVDDVFRTPDGLIEQYRTFDLVVSMRMHAAILALAAGVPVLPVAYEPKTQHLFDRLGFGDWVLDVETVGERNLCAMCDRVLAELPARRAALFEGVAAAMKSAEHGLDLLAAVIRSDVPEGVGNSALHRGSTRVL